jgi:hypothetical protein
MRKNIEVIMVIKIFQTNKSIISVHFKSELDINNASFSL